MIRLSAARLQATDPRRLLLWMPLVSSLVGLLLLWNFGLTVPVYMAVLLLLVGFGGCALFGPARLQGPLLVAAPQVYSLLLLLAWGVALYVLPGHPASGMALLAASLHLPTIYVFLFLQWPPALAVRLSSLTLAVFLGITLPHTWITRAEFGPYEGPGLPLTLLFAHGTLLAVLHSFSQVRDQLAQEQERTRQMHELAHRDPLTGLRNRRALEDDLLGAAAGCLLAVIDIDGLKQDQRYPGPRGGRPAPHALRRGVRAAGRRKWCPGLPHQRRRIRPPDAGRRRRAGDRAARLRAGRRPS